LSALDAERSILGRLEDSHPLRLNLHGGLAFPSRSASNLDLAIPFYLVTKDEKKTIWTSGQTPFDLCGVLTQTEANIHLVIGLLLVHSLAPVLHRSQKCSFDETTIYRFNRPGRDFLSVRDQMNQVDTLDPPPWKTCRPPLAVLIEHATTPETTPFPADPQNRRG